MNNPNWSAIAAMTDLRVIGNGPKIPWHISEDFRHFKKTTMGKTIVVGRKTFETLPPLPGRDIIVLSNNTTTLINGRLPISIETLKKDYAEKELIFCGGGEIYKALLSYFSKLILTKVHLNYPGDVFFPKFESQFKLTEILCQTPIYSIEIWNQKK